MSMLAFSPLSLALAALLVAAAVITWAVRRSKTIVFDKTCYPGPVQLRRLTMWARYVGLTVAVPTFVLVALVLGDYYCGLFLAPAVAGALLVMVVMGGRQMAYGGARTPGSLEWRAVE